MTASHRVGRYAIAAPLQFIRCRGRNTLENTEYARAVSLQTVTTLGVLGAAITICGEGLAGRW
jgi:hypothetical protein